MGLISMMFSAPRMKIERIRKETKIEKAKIKAEARQKDTAANPQRKPFWLFVAMTWIAAICFSAIFTENDPVTFIISATMFAALAIYFFIQFKEALNIKQKKDNNNDTFKK